MNDRPEDYSHFLSDDEIVIYCSCLGWYPFLKGDIAPRYRLFEGKERGTDNAVKEGEVKECHKVEC